MFALKEEDYEVVVVVVVIFHVLNNVAPRSQFLEYQFSERKDEYADVNDCMCI